MNFFCSRWTYVQYSSRKLEAILFQITEIHVAEHCRILSLNLLYEVFWNQRTYETELRTCYRLQNSSDEKCSVPYNEPFDRSSFEKHWRPVHFEKYCISVCLERFKIKQTCPCCFLIYFTIFPFLDTYINNTFYFEENCVLLRVMFDILWKKIRLQMSLYLLLSLKPWTGFLVDHII